MQHRTCRKVATAAAMVVFVAVASSADDQETYSLNTRCSTLGVIVDSVEERRDKGDRILGITEADLQYAVESRLRGAGIYDDDQTRESVVVAVTVFNNAFAINVALRRFLDDTGHGRPGAVQVWSDDAIGTHAWDKQYVLGGVSQYLDRFLTLYLRSNEAWCAMLESGDFSALLKHEGLTIAQWRDRGLVPTGTDKEVEQRAWNVFGHKYPLSRAEFRSQFLDEPEATR